MYKSRENTPIYIYIYPFVKTHILKDTQTYIHKNTHIHIYTLFIIKARVLFDIVFESI